LFCKVNRPALAITDNVRTSNRQLTPPAGDSHEQLEEFGTLREKGKQLAVATSEALQKLQHKNNKAKYDRLCRDYQAGFPSAFRAAVYMHSLAPDDRPVPLACVQVALQGFQEMVKKEKDLVRKQQLHLADTSDRADGRGKRRDADRTPLLHSTTEDCSQEMANLVIERSNDVRILSFPEGPPSAAHAPPTCLPHRASRARSPSPAHALPFAMERTCGKLVCARLPEQERPNVGTANPAARTHVCLHSLQMKRLEDDLRGLQGIFQDVASLVRAAAPSPCRQGSRRSRLMLLVDHSPCVPPAAVLSGTTRVGPVTDRHATWRSQEPRSMGGAGVGVQTRYQGDHLDSIEVHVQGANEDVHEAHEELIKVAQTFQLSLVVPFSPMRSS
jgi:hypothetical protein